MKYDNFCPFYPDQMIDSNFDDGIHTSLLSGKISCGYTYAHDMLKLARAKQIKIGDGYELACLYLRYLELGNFT